MADFDFNPAAAKLNARLRRPMDTSADADAVQLEILREITPEQRSILAAKFSDEIREVALAGIRSRHPGINERQVVIEFARQTLTPQEFKLAYGNTGTDS